MDKNSTMEFRATTLFDKLKELLYGSSRKNYMESHLHLWEYIFESELLGFDALELLPIASQNPALQYN